MGGESAKIPFSTKTRKSESEKSEGMEGDEPPEPPGILLPLPFALSPFRVFVLKRFIALSHASEERAGVGARGRELFLGNRRRMTGGGGTG
jgi:hypothetical protein